MTPACHCPSIASWSMDDALAPALLRGPWMMLLPQHCSVVHGRCSSSFLSLPSVARCCVGTATRVQLGTVECCSDLLLRALWAGLIGSMGWHISHYALWIAHSLWTRSMCSAKEGLSKTTSFRFLPYVMLRNVGYYPAVRLPAV